MLRLAAWRLCEAGIVPSMLVHDGILIEANNEEQISQSIEIMNRRGGMSAMALIRLKRIKDLGAALAIATKRR